MIGQPVFTYMEAYDYPTMALNMQQFRKELALYVNNPNRQIICDIYQIWDGSQVYVYNDRENDWEEDIEDIEWEDCCQTGSYEWNESVRLVGINSYEVDPWTTPILTNECLSCMVDMSMV
ncbi:MAG: hypothetical protein ACOVRN_00520 [Flavobacterium sp.]|jgi:hypothetical protein